MKAIQKIDIHAHATAFPEYMPTCRWGGRFCSGEEVLKLYDELHIEKGVLLPLTAPEAQITPMTSENCKWVADQFPDRFLWFCGVDPRALKNTSDTDIGALLAHYKELGAKGVGELTAQLYADDPKVDNLFMHSAKLDLPVLIHIAPHFDGCYGLVDALGLPRIEKMLKKHKNLKLIGHSQPFWSEISADNTEKVRNSFPSGKVKEGRIAFLMRNYENLYCDISAGSGLNALRRDMEYAARFLEEFADKILYGCDICGVGNKHPFEMDAFLNEMVEKGYLSEENYYKIVRGNAIRLLKLS